MSEVGFKLKLIFLLMLLQMFPKNVFIMLNFDQTDLSLQIDNDHVGDWSEVCECVDDGDVGRVLVGLDV